MGLLEAHFSRESFQSISPLFNSTPTKRSTLDDIYIYIIYADMQFLHFCLCYPRSKSCRVTCSFGAGTLAAPPLVDGSSGDPSLQWTWNTFHGGNVCSFCWCFSMSIDVCCWWWWRIWCIYIYIHIYMCIWSWWIYRWVEWLELQLKSQRKGIM